ncbi:MAG: Do family serine endopeptidase [Planctomycetaceae bacterium]|nr:Do family serine endopeptidase [Planctomycetaceae bacterium]
MKKTLRWPLTLLAGGAVVLASWSFLHSVQPAMVRAQQNEGPPPAVARADELSAAFRYVAKKALPAVVSIEATAAVQSPRTMQLQDPFGDDVFRDHPFFRDFFERMPQQQAPGRRRNAVARGSGFIIDSSGVVMTNAHVVRGADEVRVRLSDGREFTATDIKADDLADVAIVRIDVKEKLPVIPLGDDSQMEIGDWVLAFGSPFGLHRTVTQGIVSAKSRALPEQQLRQEFIQTDAAINPGNSGGPLVNMHGEVIGINTAISTSSGGYDGVGFAVPISQARWVGDQLLSAGKVRRAYIGVVPEDIDARTANELKLSAPSGAQVVQITRDSPADKAGLQLQDVIVELNGQKITGSNNLKTVAEKLTIGQTYPVTVMRDGKPVQMKLTVEEFPEDLGTGHDVDSNGGTAISELGLVLQPLTPGLARQLGLSDSVGFVISEVVSGGPGERYGLEAGSVITRIGSTELNSISDLEGALKEASDAGQITIFVKTANRTQLLRVPFQSNR